MRTPLVLTCQYYLILDFFFAGDPQLNRSTYILSPIHEEKYNLEFHWVSLL